MEASIVVRGVHKGFGSGPRRTMILHGINMEVYRGETVFLVGPSGSGKTTLLSLLGCLLTPDRGNVRVLGQEIAEATPLSWRRSGGTTLALSSRRSTSSRLCRPWIMSDWTWHARRLTAECQGAGRRSSQSRWPRPPDATSPDATEHGTSAGRRRSGPGERSGTAARRRAHGLARCREWPGGDAPAHAVDRGTRGDPGDRDPRQPNLPLRRSNSPNFLRTDISPRSRR